MRRGSETLTSYVLAIANEAGWKIGPTARAHAGGTAGVHRRSYHLLHSLPTADLALRKMAAIEALSRYEAATPRCSRRSPIEPNLWPTSGVIDWFNVLNRMQEHPGAQRELRQAEQILRSRLELPGDRHGFSTEKSDCLWWLMLSNDMNAVRLLGSVDHLRQVDAGCPRMVRGALSRQYQGHWDLTTANAWGVLAMEKFSNAFEKTPVTGTSSAVLAGKTASVNWAAKPKGDQACSLGRAGDEQLGIQHSGTGQALGDHPEPGGNPA